MQLGKTLAANSLSCVLVVLAGMLAGCGTTQIRTSDPKAKIFVDGALAGEGNVEVKRMGPPRTMEVVVTQHGREVVKTEVKREFTAITLLTGMLTIYTGLFWGWQYPSEVVLEMPKAAAGTGWEEGASPWDVKDESPWGRPYVENPGQ